MFSGVIDFSDVIYSFAIGSVGAIMFVLVDKYEPEGPLARILKFLVLFVSSAAILPQTAAIRASTVLAGVSADASPGVPRSGSAPSAATVWAPNRLHSSTEAGVLCHCSLQIVLHQRLTDKWKAATIALSSGHMITFKLSRVCARISPTHIRLYQAC